MKRKVVAASIGAVAFGAAALLVNMTRPSEVGPLGVLAFFVLAYITSISLFYLILDGGRGLLERILPPGGTLLAIQSTRTVKMYYFASIIALAPVVLIGVRSIGEVGLVEIVLLVVFEVLGCFYVSRRF